MPYLSLDESAATSTGSESELGGLPAGQGLFLVGVFLGILCVFLLHASGASCADALR